MSSSPGAVEWTDFIGHSCWETRTGQLLFIGGRIFAPYNWCWPPESVPGRMRAGQA